MPPGVQFREQCGDWARGHCNMGLNCPWLHDQRPRFLDTDDQSDSDDKSMEDLRRFLVYANGNEVEGEASPTRSRPRPPRSRSGLWPRGSVAREIQPPPSPRSEAVRQVQPPPSATLSARFLDCDDNKSQWSRSRPPRHRRSPGTLADIEPSWDELDTLGSSDELRVRLGGSMRACARGRELGSA